MITPKMSQSLALAKCTLKNEGLATLLRRSFEFYIFHHGQYYLYRNRLGTVEDIDEAALLPRIGGVTFRTVCDNREADELAESTGHDFRKHDANARNRLDKGAIAFCTFVNDEIANVGWMALNEQAMKALSPVPLKVRFADNECYTGATKTFPKYRGMGLMNHNALRTTQFRKEMGIETSHFAILASSVAPQRAVAKTGGKIYAKARYVRFLWWKLWRETPIAETTR